MINQSKPARKSELESECAQTSQLTLHITLPSLELWYFYHLNVLTRPFNEA